MRHSSWPPVSWWILGLALSMACGKDVSAPGVALVVVTPDTFAMYVGQTRTFSAVALDTRGDTVTGKAVTWATSDSVIASISAAGLLTAHRAGAVDVEASVAGVQGIAHLTVTLVPVGQVVVFPPAETLFVGHAVLFAVTTTDSAGNPLTGRAVVWTSSNLPVAGVSGSGLATAHDTGSAWIRASVEGHSDSAQLTVQLAPV